MYSCGIDVYYALDKIFNYLYKNSEKFRKEISKSGYVRFHKSEDGNYISDSGIICNGDIVVKVFKGVKDKEFGEYLNNIVEFPLFKVHLYKPYEAYFYIDDLVFDCYDDDRKIEIQSDVYIYMEDYPKIDDLVAKKGDSKSWVYKDIPKNIKSILLTLSKGVADANNMFSNFYGYYTLGKLYMKGSELYISSCNPIEVCGDYKYDCTTELEKCCSNLLKVLKLPIKELYWFRKGNLDTIKYKKHSDGEYTVVII